MKEKVLAVRADTPPRYGDRIVNFEDFGKIVTDKKGKRITLAKHKRIYPYIVVNEVLWTVLTTERDFSFKIPAEYVWNGADIPSFLWMFAGSKDCPQFKVPSMIHDYMLEYKEYIYKNILYSEISVSEYRRLTSLVFRELLKNYGTKTVKSNIMSGCVQGFQSVCNRREWEFG